MWRPVAEALLVSSVVACGASAGRSSSSDAGGSSDALVDASPMRDAPEDRGKDARPDGPIPYPAPHPGMPTVVSSGGLVLLAPSVIPITFPNDAYASDIASFISAIGASTYWTATTSEYGVGPLTLGPAVMLPEDPFPTATTVDDSQIQTWLAQAINEGELPAYDGNGIYGVFFPATKTVTLDGATSCSEFGGYHDEVQLMDGEYAPYLVIPRCATFDDLSGLDEVTATASHEMIESSTDPLPETAPAYASVDEAHVVWQLVLGGGEIADMCAQNANAFFQPADLPYAVQRVWSNVAATGGHDPCVPAPAGAYFNASPVLPDAVTIDNGDMATTAGVVIPIGQKKAVTLDLYSDAPTTGPWSITAQDVASLEGEPEELAFSPAEITGQNGDVSSLTIDVSRGGQFGVEAFVLTSSLGARTTFWIGLVSSE